MRGGRDLRRIDDGSRLADTLGVRDRLTQAREVPVAHSPRRKAALLQRERRARTGSQGRRRVVVAGVCAGGRGVV
eukprot:6502891-Prymnesium_polylepis.1